jgi:hypothetical protein
VDGFYPSMFTMTMHQSSKFPLRGSHGAVICNECHRPPLAEPDSPVTFRFADLSCTGCHADPHNGQFASAISTGDAADKLICTSCHTEDSWEETGTFNHSQTGFELMGAHRTVSCIQCHLASPQEARIQAVNFSLAPSECAGCHEDVHAGQFASPDGNTAGEGCHMETNWSPNRFDHNRGNSFSLVGEHERVACDRCLSSSLQIAGRSVIVYKGTPQTCADCHSN